MTLQSKITCFSVHVREKAIAQQASAGTVTGNGIYAVQNKNNAHSDLWNPDHMGAPEKETHDHVEEGQGHLSKKSFRGGVLIHTITPRVLADKIAMSNRRYQNNDSTCAAREN